MTAIRTALAVFASVLLASIVVAGEDATGSPLRSALEVRYTELKSAIEGHDAEALAAILAPDFETEDVEGHTTTGEQMIHQLGLMPADPARVSETTLLSVSRTGDTAVVEQRYHMTTTRTPPGGGAPQQMELTAVSTDTWLRIQGVWRIERSVTNSMEYKVNGTVVMQKQGKGGAQSSS